MTAVITNPTRLARARGFSTIGTTLVVLLTGLLSFGIWKLAAGNQVSFMDVAEERLAARFEKYCELRLADDWVSMYELVDPQERRTVTLSGFLQHYGQGYMKTHAVEARSYEVFEISRTGIVKMTIDAELMIDKLPAQYRNVQAEGEDVRRAVDHDMVWVWREGQWYYALDQAVTSGTDENGQEVKPL